MPHSRGFTLFELIVVMLIVGILAAIAMPMFAGIRHASELAAAEQEVSGFLNRARWMAITSGRPQTTVQLANCNGGVDCTILQVVIGPAGSVPVIAQADLSQYGATVSPVGTTVPFSLDNRGFVAAPSNTPSLTVTSTKLGKTKSVSVSQLGKVQSS